MSPPCCTVELREEGAKLLKAQGFFWQWKAVLGTREAGGAGAGSMSSHTHICRDDSWIRWGDVSNHRTEART